MALFGDSNNGEIERLQADVNNLREANKRGAAHLASARQMVGELQAEIATLKVVVEGARAAVLKARKRQKNSVERANRFKARTEKMSQIQPSSEQ